MPKCFPLRESCCAVGSQWILSCRVSIVFVLTSFIGSRAASMFHSRLSPFFELVRHNLSKIVNKQNHLEYSKLEVGTSSYGFEEPEAAAMTLCIRVSWRFA